MSPTQRSLAVLRERGFVAQVVEKWIPQTRQRLDLFGGIDILAIGNGQIAGVQATSASNHAARKTKLLAEPRLREWVSCGGNLWLHSWGKRVERYVRKDGSKGKRERWTLREEFLWRDEFPDRSDVPDGTF